MPGRDRTGPMGFGPMTGRGMGWCGRAGAGPYRGYGRFDMFGWGRGRGWRNRYYATGVPGWAWSGWGGPWGGASPFWGAAAGEDELSSLKNHAAGLEEELANIKARMADLEKEREAR